MINLYNIILTRFLQPVGNFLFPKTSNKKVRFFSYFLVFVLILFFLTYIHLFSIKISNMTINKDFLDMNVGDEYNLKVNVLYSNNTITNDVIWSSSDESVAKVCNNGNVIALSSGTTTIIAQASKNNDTKSVTCNITVKSPPRGYSINVIQGSIDSEIYVWIKPYDSNYTKINIHCMAPSGNVLTFKRTLEPIQLDSECGLWTIYASIENDDGIYMGNKSSDFVTINVTELPNS